MLSIWMYAFITGMSPSVMRASVMFSFFAVREYGKHKSNPYNILAASAFLLLIFDPFIITKVGFQLSYAAVLAIVALFDPIYKLLVFKNAIFNSIWKLMVVSLAAQLGTFPIAVFYFHQFPAYFFLTNLIVIPLVWLIIYFGIAVLVTSFFWQLLSLKLSAIFYVQLWVLNGSVEWVDALPGANISGLVLYLPQVILIYFSLIAFTQYLIRIRGSMLVAGLFSILLLIGSFVLVKYEHLQQRQLVIYDVKDHTALDVFWGEHMLAIGDTALMQDDRKIGYSIEPNRIYSGVDTTIYLGIDTLSGFFGFDDIPLKVIDRQFLLAGSRRIAIFDGAFQGFLPAKPLDVDLVVLRGNPKYSIDEIAQMFSFEQLVFDASNNRWKVNEWKKLCLQVGIDFHDVGSEGAFVYELAPEKGQNYLSYFP